MTAMDLTFTHFLATVVGLAIGSIVVGVIVARRRAPMSRLLRRHFGTDRSDELVITSRRFQARIRSDLQKALDQFFAAGVTINHTCGVRQENRFDAIGFTDLFAEDTTVPPVALEFEDIDIGEETPVRCTVKGLWLLTHQGQRYAVLMSPMGFPGEPPLVQVQVAGKAGDGEFAERLFEAMEDAVRNAVSYRGKVLSLEDGSLYMGQATGLTVHKLRGVGREEVILPPKTLDLLDRNVVRFVRHRGSLRRAGQAIRKGLLFYGPPGNGKTHTIHYLIRALEGHTTLLIAAEEVKSLGEYMTLARLLQPSVVVIEDVDLIARERTDLDSPCQESLLNKLLNEMDGLKEDAEILFILTTNRPADLEKALASRPGRVDQAIEFPLPDEDCRRKLVQLYARGIQTSGEVVDAIVSKTAGASAAFMKELVRRSMLHHLDRTDEPVVDLQDVDNALEELLVGGGSLNRMLLGADGNLAGFAAGVG